MEDTGTDVLRGRVKLHGEPPRSMDGGEWPMAG